MMRWGADENGIQVHFGRRLWNYLWVKLGIENLVMFWLDAVVVSKCGFLSFLFF